MKESFEQPISRRDFLRLCALALAATAVGCMPEGVVSTSEPVNKPTDTLEPTAEATPSVSAEEIPILKVDISKGGYSERQIKQIEENVVLKEKIRVMSEDWVRWWASADEPEISAKSIMEDRVKITIKFDPRDPETGDNALVVLENQDNPGLIIMQPWDISKGGFMDRFPEVDSQGNVLDRSAGHANVSGMNPFFMETAGNNLRDGTKSDWIWENVEGQPAKADVLTFKPLERLNHNGEWEMAGKEFILPKTVITSVREAVEDDFDPGLVEAMKISVSALGTNFYINRWGVGQDGETVMVVKDEGYPENEYWGCPVYEPGIGSRLVLMSKEKLREAEEKEIVRKTDDTALIVDMSSAKGNEIRHFLKYLQGLRVLIERRPKSSPEFSNAKMFEDWMNNWMESEKDTDAYAKEIHHVTVICNSNEVNSMAYKWVGLSSSLRYCRGKRMDLGESEKHAAFVLGMKHPWTEIVSSIPVLRGGDGEKIFMSSQEGDNLSPERFSSNEAAKQVFREYTTLSHRLLFMTAIADEEKFLFPEAAKVDSKVFVGLDEVWLEGIKKYGGWVDEALDRYLSDAKFSEKIELISDFLNNDTDIPMEIMTEFIDVFQVDRDKSYFDNKICRFED